MLAPVRLHDCLGEEREGRVGVDSDDDGGNACVDLALLIPRVRKMSEGSRLS